MLLLEIVKIRHPDGDGYMIVNKADFNPAVHKVWEGPETEPAEKVATSPLVETPKADDLTTLTRAALIESLEAAGGSLAEVKGTGKKGYATNADIVLAIQTAARE